MSQGGHLVFNRPIEEGRHVALISTCRTAEVLFGKGERGEGKREREK